MSHKTHEGFYKSVLPTISFIRHVVKKTHESRLFDLVHFMHILDLKLVSSNN